MIKASAGGILQLKDLLEAYEFVINTWSDSDPANNIQVVSMSYGGGYSQALYDAINRARTAGIIFVAAAGIPDGAREVEFAQLGQVGEFDEFGGLHDGAGERVVLRPLGRVRHPDLVGRVAGAEPVPRRAAQWGLAVLTLVNLINYLDRFVVAALFEAYAESRALAWSDFARAQATFDRF